VAVARARRAGWRLAPAGVPIQRPVASMLRTSAS
jgi:hypothetical protein